MTREQADMLITYLNTMSERTNHQSVMEEMERDGVTERELDQACRALGVIAERDCSILS